VQVIADYQLVFEWGVGQDNDLILVELREVCGEAEERQKIAPLSSKRVAYLDDS
jgi:hypothetical protein